MSDTQDAGWVRFLQLLPTASQTGRGDPGFPCMTQEQHQMAEGGKGHHLGVGQLLGATKLLSPVKGARGKLSTTVKGGAGQNDLAGTD